MAQTSSQYPDVAKGVPIIYGIRLSYDPAHEYRYVGLTTEGLTRFRGHLVGAKNPTNPSYNYSKSKWMRKHYFNVTFDILEIVENADLLPLAEMKWIHILKTRGHRLLNHTDGGEGIRGHKFSPETRAKLSASRTGEKNHRYGTKATQEHRDKISESNRRRVLSDATKAKIGKASKGRTHSDVTRAKMSLTHTHKNRHIKLGVSDETCSLCLGVDNTQ